MTFEISDEVREVLEQHKFKDAAWYGLDGWVSEMHGVITIRPDELKQNPTKEEVVVLLECKLQTLLRTITNKITEEIKELRGRRDK